MEINKLKLDFLKRVLMGDTSQDVINNFVGTKEYPSIEIMNSVVESEVNPNYLEGMKYSNNSMTMIGLKRLDNIHNSLDYIRVNNICGDIVETGVWRGGCCIFIKKYLDLYDMNDRKVFVCDSFNGLPVPDVDKYPVDRGDMHHTYKELCVSVESVMKNFEDYGADGDNVKFIRGWFSDTLPNNDDIGDLAILRLDGDMYGSTMDVLSSLYEKVVDNGIIIIDDYCLDGCFKAVADFRSARSISDDMNGVDRCGVWWIKSKTK